jgi:hypothetical protein
MKVFPLLALTLSLIGGVAAYAADPVPAPAPAPKHERKPLTADQKALIKEITAKYDTNKDGKLSREERAAEDQAKMEKAGLPVGGKKAKAKPPTPAPATDK